VGVWKKFKERIVKELIMRKRALIRGITGQDGSYLAGDLTLALKNWLR